MTLGVPSLPGSIGTPYLKYLMVGKICFSGATFLRGALNKMTLVSPARSLLPPALPSHFEQEDQGRDRLLRA